MSKTTQETSTSPAAPVPGTPEPLLRAEHLVAGYIPGVNILNDCSIEVAQGELVGIIGPNGAGKSTLLKALFGLVNVREGRVMLEGKEITNRKANVLVEQGVGFVPQTNNVFPSLTIEENLRMGVFLRPKTFDRRFEFIADLFPTLAERRSQRAGSMSGGERQMVAMARALMMKPSVLLLDEPSAGLSPVRQDETFLRTRMINKSGVSIIMVEQNARRCLQICDRAYVLDQGRDAYTGTGRQLMNDPKVISLYLGTLAEDEKAAKTARVDAAAEASAAADAASAAATATTPPSTTPPSAPASSPTPQDR
ncbi:ABC transporter ATP-binding protein [Oerskovia flava]|uniref:ABC transporter ATP-binding protein n=1 Tax=Oerskovia flava TaxID=2986422 RepID=UPI002240CD9E|nr:ABC transporter ATP-binding protein [Oerskovia sp. JB1-3-2]